MKISSKFVSVLLISALAASMTLAQGQRGGQGRGAQRGGQQMNELRLLGRKDVQKDLALTDDQVTKIEEYTTKNQPQRGAGGAGGAGGGQGNGGGQRGQGGQGGGAQTDEQRAAAAKAAAERREKTRKELLEIISEAQMKRVGEIMLQLQGFNAIGQAEIQKALDMSADQIAKVKDLQAKQREASTALFQKVQSQEITREDLTAAMAKNTETMKTELGKILTEKQIASLKAMQGKTFVADEPGN
jgi:hypothetical protein